MQVGLFDHVEHGDRPLTRLFDERLNFAEAAEAAGILLPARCRASRDAIEHGACTGRLSRRGCSHGEANAAWPAGLFAAALFTAAADRGNLHARSPQPWSARCRCRPRRLALRAEIPQGRARSLARHFHRRVQMRQRRVDDRLAYLCERALYLQGRADRAAAIAAPASAVLVWLIQ